MNFDYASAAIGAGMVILILIIHSVISSFRNLTREKIIFEDNHMVTLVDSLRQRIIVRLKDSTTGKVTHRSPSDLSRRERSL
jgi:hypothetical protein